MIFEDIDIRKPDPSMCMVRDCTRTAVYRSPASRGRSKRGYCPKHRDYAMRWAERSDSARVGFERGADKLSNL